MLWISLAGTIPGCHRREPVVAPVAVEPEVKRGDDDPETIVTESTSIDEVEPADAEAKLTVRVIIPGFADSDEVYYLKKVVTRTTFERNADGVYVCSEDRAGGRSGDRCFRACGSRGSFGGSTSISPSSPDRVKVSIHRSWILAGATSFALLETADIDA